HTLAAVVSNYVPERIDPVDRAVLRLGTYAILFASTPLRVAINEAIELAKRFGTTDSHRFVNGVLDRIAQQASTVVPG
ncbi:MAG: transcription antitermination factor NusB, partial [Verrucomicrobia bacterium]|nr:transcription antitermination factor NusB [Verrucomicrobiota bacterium]